MQTSRLFSAGASTSILRLLQQQIDFLSIEQISVLFHIRISINQAFYLFWKEPESNDILIYFVEFSNVHRRGYKRFEAELYGSLVTRRFQLSLTLTILQPAKPWPLKLGSYCVAGYIHWSVDISVWWRSKTMAWNESEKPERQLVDLAKNHCTICTKMSLNPDHFLELLKSLLSGQTNM